MESSSLAAADRIDSTHTREDHPPTTTMGWCRKLDGGGGKSAVVSVVVVQGRPLVEASTIRTSAIKIIIQSIGDDSGVKIIILAGTAPSYNPRWQNQKNLECKHSRVGDNYCSINEFMSIGCFCSGLESSNLIVGIDVTKRNEWTGVRSFGRKSLHYIGTTPDSHVMDSEMACHAIHEGLKLISFVMFRVYRMKKRHMYHKFWKNVRTQE
ncbi:unnamed protein product [Eruca vesicaria subsp. sativa]|uniref:Uncharacterized protein n=1 Tax=Eruca vesicaria subsp. sativa TaxID=29727 RepID=A0ABC8J8M7_ERUVS|nr:unnamed protein product [Eruca vesicaria subsp. sativa]